MPSDVMAISEAYANNKIDPISQSQYHNVNHPSIVSKWLHSGTGTALRNPNDAVSRRQNKFFQLSSSLFGDNSERQKVRQIGEQNFKRQIDESLKARKVANFRSRQEENRIDAAMSLPGLSNLGYDAPNPLNTNPYGSNLSIPTYTVPPIVAPSYTGLNSYSSNPPNNYGSNLGTLSPYDNPLYSSNLNSYQPAFQNNEIPRRNSFDYSPTQYSDGNTAYRPNDVNARFQYQTDLQPGDDIQKQLRDEQYQRIQQMQLENNEAKKMIEEQQRQRNQRDDQILESNFQRQQHRVRQDFEAEQRRKRDKEDMFKKKRETHHSRIENLSQQLNSVRLTNGKHSQLPHISPNDTLSLTKNQKFTQGLRDERPLNQKRGDGFPQQTESNFRRSTSFSPSAQLQQVPAARGKGKPVGRRVPPPQKRNQSQPGPSVPAGRMNSDRPPNPFFDNDNWKKHLPPINRTPEPTKVAKKKYFGNKKPTKQNKAAFSKASKSRPLKSILKKKSIPKLIEATEATDASDLHTDGEDNNKIEQIEEEALDQKSKPSVTLLPHVSICSPSDESTSQYDLQTNQADVNVETDDTKNAPFSSSKDQNEQNTTVGEHVTTTENEVSLSPALTKDNLITKNGSENSTSEEGCNEDSNKFASHVESTEYVSPESVQDEQNNVESIANEIAQSNPSRNSDAVPSISGDMSDTYNQNVGKSSFKATLNDTINSEAILKNNTLKTGQMAVAEDHSGLGIATSIKPHSTPKVEATPKVEGTVDHSVLPPESPIKKAEGYEINKQTSSSEANETQARHFSAELPTTKDPPKPSKEDDIAEHGEVDVGSLATSRKNSYHSHTPNILILEGSPAKQNPVKFDAESKKKSAIPLRIKQDIKPARVPIWDRVLDRKVNMKNRLTKIKSFENANPDTASQLAAIKKTLKPNGAKKVVHKRPSITPSLPKAAFIPKRKPAKRVPTAELTPRQSPILHKKSIPQPKKFNGDVTNKKLLKAFINNVRKPEGNRK